MGCKFNYYLIENLMKIVEMEIFQLYWPLTIHQASKIEHRVATSSKPEKRSKLY